MLSWAKGLLREDDKGDLYATLTTSPSAIRIITLLPGLWSDPIACSLRETHLPVKEPYKALSYAWNNGYQVADVRVQVNGQPVSIGHNLYTALRRIRDIERPVDIWVDSLCINQDDDAERTHQVNLMREIYGNSSEVVIWLGEKDVSDDLGESFWPSKTDRTLGRMPEGNVARVEWYGDDRDLFKLNAYVSSVSSRSSSPNGKIRDVFGAFCVLYLLSMGVPATEIVHLRHIQYSRPIVSGLHAIMDKSWWQRIWVVQETVVAKKATIYYGQLSAPWTMFSHAAIGYDKTHLLRNADSVYPYLYNGQPLMHFSRIVIEIESTRRLWLKVQPTTLLPLLRKFRARHATDGRDKVFALLGLVRHWAGVDRIIPDYGMEASQVFRETTITAIQATKSLSILAGTLQRDSMQWADHPSWVADFASPPDVHENIRVDNSSLYNASKGLSGTVRVHGVSILETNGIHIDDIAFVGQQLPLSADGHNSRLRLSVSEWEKTLSQLGTSDYIAGGTIADAFWRLICGDVEHCKDAGGKYDEAKVEFRRAKASVWSTYEQWRWAGYSANRRTSIIAGYWKEVDDEEGISKMMNAFHHAVECASGLRRIFITSRGYIGTGPDEIKVGDDIFTLYGSRVPFVLRSVDYATICASAPVRELFGVGNDGRGRIDLTKPGDKKLELKVLETICHETHHESYRVVGDAYVHGIMDGEVTMTKGRSCGFVPKSVFLV